MTKGSCLCGAVRFETVAPGHAGACHCTQCRKHSGHYWASADVPRDKLRLEGADKITWYYSSAKARRGFCSVCGSSLFWDPVDEDFIEIALGSFDTPTQTRLARHIFVAEKGDYYEIADGLPQYDKFAPDTFSPPSAGKTS